MFIAVTPSVEIVGSAAYFRSHAEWMIQEPYANEVVGHILGYLISEAGAGRPSWAQKTSPTSPQPTSSQPSRRLSL